MAHEQQKKYSNFLKMVAYSAGFALIAVFGHILNLMNRDETHGKDGNALKPDICN